MQACQVQRLRFPTCGVASPCARHCQPSSPHTRTSSRSPWPHRQLHRAPNAHQSAPRAPLASRSAQNSQTPPSACPSARCGRSKPTPPPMPESTLLPDVLHLVAFGQLGVLVRYWLGYAFGGGCTAGSSWLPCVTSPGLIRTGGALFTDLPANIVGSAVMGFLSPADLLLLGQAQPQCPQPKAQQGTQPDATTQRSPAIQPGTPCAALPTGSVLQKHSPLLLGLRTGFCGCCTTFASW